jgi:hypothetical protein
VISLDPSDNRAAPHSDPTSGPTRRLGAPCDRSPLHARPLYLTGGAQTRVDLDGPALLVRAPFRAPARYPLARVSRVVSSIRVGWAMPAQLACLDSGIPIVYLGRDGMPAGFLLPVNRRASRLDAALDELLDRPDWSSHYANWLRAERMRALSAWMQAREAEGELVPLETYRELRRRHVYGEQEALPVMRSGIHCAALMALVAEQITKAGLRHVYWGEGGRALELLRDLARLLALRLELELTGLGTAARAENAALLRIFHAFVPQLGQHCAAMIGRLHRRVREVLEEWR